jgi:ribosomal protein S12 methylthiotransferase
MKSYYIHRLGCPKNDVDAEYIEGFLQQQNLTAADQPEKADLIIVNSCGFIQSAKEESINAVLSMAKLKEMGHGKKLIITGCLSQRYAADLARDIPELDGIFGLDNFTGIRQLLDRDGHRVIERHDNSDTFADYDFPRAVRPHEPFAYIKISDGCDNRCSYCAIPDIRGHFRSKPIEAVCREAELLLEAGKKELILVSQESTAYGLDLYGQPRLIELLEGLSGLGGHFWIRVMYLHPARLKEDLIDYMIDNRRICSYFDLPLQHINDELLLAMRRKMTRKHVEAILERIRSGKSRAAVRTNFIVGFPGETDNYFEELCRFVESNRFDRLGAFTYSAEEGTPAAVLPDQVDEDIKDERYHRLMELQQQIAFENNDREVGRSLEVIIDEVDSGSGRATGRTRFDAPEIDQNIRFDASGATQGDIVTVTITGCDGYDLLGEREEL